MWITHSSFCHAAYMWPYNKSVWCVVWSTMIRTLQVSYYNASLDCLRIYPGESHCISGNPFDSEDGEMITTNWQSIWSVFYQYGWSYSTKMYLIHKTVTIHLFVSVKTHWQLRHVCRIKNMRITRRPWWPHQMKTFPRYWPFVRGIHRSPVNSQHKGQWCGL